jgi:hypothetical protein
MSLIVRAELLSAHLYSLRAGKCRATRATDQQKDPDIDNDV